jgi:TrkA-N domain
MTRLSGCGFCAVLLAETAVTMAAAHYSLIDALYTVTKVTVTVGPSTAADEDPGWLKAFSTAATLLTVGFAAVLTAGLVDRLLDPRLIGIVGKSAVPRREHVVVVGLGQVGSRLAMLLRELGLPVVAIEHKPDAKNVPKAKDQRLPIVIASGASQRLLRRLSTGRARAIAAVTSDDVENIAIAIAARSVRQDIHIALRGSDVPATEGPQWLFGIGVVRDVYRIAAAALAATILAQEPYEAFPHGRVMYLVDEKSRISALSETVPLERR